MSKGKATRRSILHRALDLSSSVGLEGLTIGTLAARVGLSKSGLYAHFRSKEELQSQVLEAAGGLFIEEVVSPAFLAPRGLPRLRALFERWLDWTTDALSGGCVFIAAAVEFDDRPGPVRDVLVAQQQGVIDMIVKAARLGVDEGHLRRDLDLDQFAFGFWGILLSYHYFSRLLRADGARVRATRAFEDLLRDAGEGPAAIEAWEPPEEAMPDHSGATPRLYGAGYRETVRLRDGSAVLLKTLRPEDKGLLAAGFEHLSKESRFRRFFTFKSRLTEGELRYFTEIDGEAHFALGAGRRGEDGVLEGLGTARFVRKTDEPEAAELAVAVVDEWQGLGLGRALLTRLIEAAEERGIERLVGTVMGENDVMIHLLGTAARARLRWRDGFVEVELELRPGPAGSRGGSSHLEDGGVPSSSE
jgi:AcrR family transcriptional regulator/GNAT superfamily N-acetyltransferase